MNDVTHDPIKEHQKKIKKMEITSTLEFFESSDNKIEILYSETFDKKLYINDLTLIRNIKKMVLEFYEKKYSIEMVERTEGLCQSCYLQDVCEDKKMIVDLCSDYFSKSI